MKAVFTCGRMNPVTIGHEKLLNKIDQLCCEQGGRPFVFLTKTHDSVENPLTIDEKIQFVCQVQPSFTYLPTVNAFSATDYLLANGFTELVCVFGEDRTDMANRLVKFYTGHMTSHIIDRASNDVSATIVRKMVITGNRKMFNQMVPSCLNKNKLYKTLQVGMGIKNGSNNKRINGHRS